TLVVANSQWLTSPGRHKKSLPVQTVEAQTSTNVVHYVQQILPWKSEYLGYLTTRSTIRRQVGGIPPLVIRPITITVFSDQDNCALVSHSYSLHETFVDLHHALTRYAKLNIRLNHITMHPMALPDLGSTMSKTKFAKFMKSQQLK